MNEAEPFYRIGVLSDTHGHLDARLFSIFAGVQLILHAGDIGREDVLFELEMIAPVCAVSGNVDGAPDPRRRPMFRQLETPAGRIALTHGHSNAAPTHNKLRLIEHFHGFRPQIIVFGHSHIPYFEDTGEVVLFNPGSAGHARGGHARSVGLITVAREGDAPHCEHVELG